MVLTLCKPGAFKVPDKRGEEQTTISAKISLGNRSDRSVSSLRRCCNIRPESSAYK
jgi:hypothetical protein